MWIFLSGGLLMPAIVPMNLADPKFTEGKFNLQVRSREVRALTNFIRDYMEPGTFHEEIQLNPDMDYNCRFYTTHEAFAAAVSRAIADIDYEKFKPTAENEKYGTKAETSRYHNVLNSIWGTVTKIAPAGGSWSTYSKSNPKGYKPSKAQKKFSGGSVRFSDAGGQVGNSFLDEYGDEYLYQSNVPEFKSAREKQEFIDEILEEVDAADIEPEKWSTYLTYYEYNLVREIAQQRMNDDNKPKVTRRRRTQRRNGQKAVRKN